MLAPIDLQDPAQVAAVMNIAARIGSILITNGTTSSDARASIHTVTSSYGLHYCHIDITVNTMTIHTIIGVDRRTPVSVFRVVTDLSENYHKLQEVDRLIRSIRSGATPPEVAEKILDDIERSYIPYRNLRFLGGWAVMGSAIAILLGGDVFMAALGGFTAFLIMGINKILSRNDLPYFFHCVLGGLLATIPALMFYNFSAQIGQPIVPSQVIATGIVVLLAGLTLVQSLLDGITGAPVTASARFFQTMLHTGGIVAGVATGITLGEMFGVGLPPLETMLGTPTFGSAVARVLGGTVAASAFAVTCFAERPAVFVSAATALAGSVIYYVFLLPLGTDRLLATAACAVVIGLAGGLIARRFMINPVITAVAGVTPFLPGSGIYRGMYAIMNEQMVVGMTNLFMAVGTCMALAGGVVFGEWMARRIRRPQLFTPYAAFRRAGRVTFTQIRRAEQAARRATRPKRGGSTRLPRPTERAPRDAARDTPSGVE
ncbi:amino acid export carrier protein [Corynebacterium liangguodongii]|uniref:Amino acid export carrier protein n=1 Tax=Corynebacterium liangguodongii TaxID=2079535 RepID=A0A2S0WH94_9CORY|nr:amino acid export carrier protein [Corynebacterium liangguodongii]PWB99764.1 amino acid export carrier protein [Corynebacterium liangguodongii]